MFSLTYSQGALADLERLDNNVAKRVIKKLVWLQSSADRIPHHAMEGKFSDFYRLRVGDYRVIYSLNHSTRSIVVEAVGHRSDVYKR